jgi:dolichyl-phosphate-mannose--protein O-mannosyl transferase
MMGDNFRRFYYMLLAIAVLGAFFRLYGIGDQPPISDEVQVAFSAENYMEQGQFGPTMPYHPNLRNILVYASAKVLGTGVLGLRGWSLLFGVLSIPVLGLLLYRVTSNVAASGLAAFFLAVDPVHITFSRQAIQEVHTAFFFLAGALLAVTGAKARRPWLLAPAGLLFGLGAASKAHALFPLLVCLGYVLYLYFKERRPWRDIVFAALSLTVLPFTVYFLTYAPWFTRGYGLWDWVFMQKSLFQYMATHRGNPMDSMIDITPVLWFIKPFMGYGNFTHFEGKPFVTVAMGNPLVWMLVIPSTVYVIYRKEVEGRGLLLALFLVAYLPLAIATRPIWVISSIAVAPFAYGIVGLAVSRVIKNGKVLAAYLVLVLLASAMLYPMSVGKAWDYGYLRPLVERLNPHERELLRGPR